VDPTVRLVEPAEIKERWPLLRVDDVLGGQFVPSNGQINPLDVTSALIKGARLRGAKAIENTPVEDLLVRNGRVIGVRTARGDIACDRVLLAGGMWTHKFAKKIGVPAPLHAAEHFYIVTESVEGLTRTTPQLVVIDERAYYKEDAGKLLIGGFEATSKAWPAAGKDIPSTFSFQELPADLEHMEQVLAPAFERVPVLQKIGVKLFFCGPESFTPDGRPYMGPTADVTGLYIAAGFNSNGISSSAVAGTVMAKWLVDGLPPLGMGGVHAQRALPFQANTRYLRDRVVESVGMPMTLHWPGEFVSTARGVRHFPMHDRLLAAGAVMGERIGWEIPLYFDKPGARLPEEPSFGYQAWFPQVERECIAARDAAVLVDLSCYGKLLISGPDAVQALNHVSANEVDVAVGRSVYTHWLNNRGGTEADLTVTRLAANEFLVVTGHTSQIRDGAWFRAHLDSAWNVQCHDVTANYAAFSIHGPRSREILQALTDADLSNGALPFGAAQYIDIGYARAWVIRRSFFGELGYELYPTTDLARHVYEEVIREGSPRGLVNAGFFAMNHCRLEKGFVAFGYDIAEDDTPLEAGHRFAVAFDKPGGFIGRDALIRQRDAGPVEFRLVSLRVQKATLAEGPYLFHNEPVWRDGAIVGYVSTGAWGFRLGGSFGLASVRKSGGVTADWLSQGGFDVDVAGKRHAVDLQFAPFYDPKSDRLRS
jgi:glycine cleavage system aminomethyltransferase T/glycine/D-amino acid oxidase-like deaminating enzyme